MLALFSAKVHHPTLWRFSCSNASSSRSLVTSVPYPLSHLSFSPMHKPRSALWYLRAQVWNLIEDHPMAFPLDSPGSCTVVLLGLLPSDPSPILPQWTPLISHGRAWIAQAS